MRATKKNVNDDQFEINDQEQNEEATVEEKPEEIPETPETPADDKGKEKKRFLEAVADGAAAWDQKIQTKKEEKAKAKAEKQQKKAEKKAQKGEHSTRNKILAGAAIVGGGLLIAGKVLMDHAAQSNADYVDDGSATQMLPESTGEEYQAETCECAPTDEIETVVGEEVTMD